MMQWLDRFCDYKTFGAKITENRIMVKNIRCFKVARGRFYLKYENRG
jgi:hypothetical protein